MTYMREGSNALEQGETLSQESEGWPMRLGPAMPVESARESAVGASHASIAWPAIKLVIFLLKRVSGVPVRRT